MATFDKVPVVIQAIEDDGYHLLCEVKIGRKKLIALIDTGASKTVTSESLLAKSKSISLSDTVAASAKGMGTEDLQPQVAIIKKLQIGKQTLSNLTVGVLSFSHIELVYQQLGIKPFDLIIGGDILVKLKAVINYNKSFMKLAKLG